MNWRTLPANWSSFSHALTGNVRRQYRIWNPYEPLVKLNGKWRPYDWVISIWIILEALRSCEDIEENNPIYRYRDNAVDFLQCCPWNIQAVLLYFVFNCLHKLLCGLWCVQIIGFFICTLRHLIIILMQTYSNVLNLQINRDVYSLECVSKIMLIPLIIFCIIYGAVCFQLIHIPCDDCQSMCALSSFHHNQTGNMNHEPLLKVRSWNNGMRCMLRLHVLLYS